MPRAVNKKELLADVEKEYDALEQFLAALSEQQMTCPGALGEWSAKDVLAHLYEWQQMFFGWYAAGLRGENPPTPTAGYKWSQLPALNQMIYEKHRQLALEDVLEKFRASYRRTLQLVQDLEEDELFIPGRYAWMRNNALAQYIAANTASHYRWARKEMRKNIKVKEKKA